MSDHLPEAVRQGIEVARLASLKRSNRLCIHVGDAVHRVVRLWEGGFALAPEGTAPLRGYVDLFDGPRHVASCLVVASPDPGADGERQYEFKVRIPVADHPPVDFERPDEVPTALIAAPAPRRF